MRSFVGETSFFDVFAKKEKEILLKWFRIEQVYNCASVILPAVYIHYFGWSAFSKHYMRYLIQQEKIYLDHNTSVEKILWNEMVQSVRLYYDIIPVETYEELCEFVEDHFLNVQANDYLFWSDDKELVDTYKSIMKSAVAPTVIRNAKKDDLDQFRVVAKTILKKDLTSDVYLALQKIRIILTDGIHMYYIYHIMRHGLYWDIIPIEVAICAHNRSCLEWKLKRLLDSDKAAELIHAHLDVYSEICSKYEYDEGKNLVIPRCRAKLIVRNEQVEKARYKEEIVNCTGVSNFEKGLMERCFDLMPILAECPSKYMLVDTNARTTYMHKIRHILYLNEKTKAIKHKYQLEDFADSVLSQEVKLDCGNWWWDYPENSDLYTILRYIFIGSKTDKYYNYLKEHEDDENTRYVFKKPGIELQRIFPDIDFSRLMSFMRLSPREVLIGQILKLGLCWDIQGDLLHVSCRTNNLGYFVYKMKQHLQNISIYNICEQNLTQYEREINYFCASHLNACALHLITEYRRRVSLWHAKKTPKDCPPITIMRNNCAFEFVNLWNTIQMYEYDKLKKFELDENSVKYIIFETELCYKYGFISDNIKHLMKLIKFAIQRGWNVFVEQQKIVAAFEQ